jgi:hypothetical protein
MHPVNGDQKLAASMQTKHKHAADGVHVLDVPLDKPE